MARETVDEAQRQIGQRAAVEVDHRELFGAVERMRLAEQAVARIVHQKRRFEIACGEFARRSVGRNRRERGRRAGCAAWVAGGAIFSAIAVKLRDPPREQHDLVAVLGKTCASAVPIPEEAPVISATGLAEPAEIRSAVEGLSISMLEPP